MSSALGWLALFGIWSLLCGGVVLWLSCASAWSRLAEAPVRTRRRHALPPRRFPDC